MSLFATDGYWICHQLNLSQEKSLTESQCTFLYKKKRMQKMSWNWCWFTGLLWIECKQLYSIGLRAYITVYQKLIDFSVLSMYLASYVLRFFTEYKISQADRSDFSHNRTIYTTPQLHNIQHAPFYWLFLI